MFSGGARSQRTDDATLGSGFPDQGGEDYYRDGGLDIVPRGSGDDIGGFSYDRVSGGGPQSYARGSDVGGFADRRFFDRAASSAAEPFSESSGTYVDSEADLRYVEDAEMDYKLHEMRQAVGNVGHHHGKLIEPREYRLQEILEEEPMIETAGPAARWPGYEEVKDSMAPQSWDEASDVYTFQESLYDAGALVGKTRLGTSVACCVACMIIMDHAIALTFSTIVFFSDFPLNVLQAATTSFLEDRGASWDALRILEPGAVHGVPVVASIAVLCWLMLVIDELDSLFRLRRALAGLDVLPQYQTRLVRYVKPGSSPAEGFAELQVMGERHRLNVDFMTVFPRIAVVIILGIAGMKLIFVTNTLINLLLLVVLLRFLLGLNRRLYLTFAPRRLKCLLEGIKPILMPPSRLQRAALGTDPACLSWVKLVSVAAVVLVIHFAVLQPFHARARLASELIEAGGASGHAAVCEDLSAEFGSSRKVTRRFRSEVAELMADVAGEGAGGNCDRNKHRCGEIGMSELRALCPMTCCRHCANPKNCSAREIPGAFFSVERWSCPKSCMVPPLGLSDPAVCEDEKPATFADNTLRAYVKGLFEYLESTSDGELEVQIEKTIIYNAPSMDIHNRDWRAVIKSVSDGTLVNATTHSVWELAPGVLHPRKLTGCAFWTSWELSVILGVDLCKAGAGYRSLRTWCPLACGCVGEHHEECPRGCTTG